MQGRKKEMIERVVEHGTFRAKQNQTFRIKIVTSAKEVVSLPAFVSLCVS